MSHYLVQRITSNPRITLYLESELREILGDEALESVYLDRKNHEGIRCEVSDIFVMIGASPNTEWLEGHLTLDRNGFVCTGDSDTAFRSRFSTSSPGVFAIGDVRSGSVKRVASAVGEGSAVIPDLHRYLEALIDPTPRAEQITSCTTRKDDVMPLVPRHDESMPKAMAEAREGAATWAPPTAPRYES
jgi:thioredoxin reductase (NADPH)